MDRVKSPIKQLPEYEPQSRVHFCFLKLCGAFIQWRVMEDGATHSALGLRLEVFAPACRIE